MRAMTLRLALAQFDFPVGDVAGNARRIARLIAEARDDYGARLVLFPELALSGYPPEDLLLRPRFLSDCENALRQLAATTHGIVAVVGWPQSVGSVVYSVGHAHDCSNIGGFPVAVGAPFNNLGPNGTRVNLVAAGPLRTMAAKSIPGFAHGGTVRTPLALVGERGPELVSLPYGSYVHPNGTGPQMGGGDVHMHVHVERAYGIEDLTAQVFEIGLPVLAAEEQRHRVATGVN